jgi:hypothetical protein
MSYPASFFTDEIIKTEVKLADGNSYPLWVKELSAIDKQIWAEALSSSNHEEKRQGMAKVIASCLVNEDGSSAVTVEQATKLKDTVLLAMLSAISKNSSKAEKQKKG